MTIVGAYLVDTAFGPAVVPAHHPERVDAIAEWCNARDDVPWVYYVEAESQS